MQAFLIGLFFTAIAYIFRPKPKPPQPQEFNERGFPRADEGDEVGTLGGYVWIKSQHVHWWGDTFNIAITKKTGKK